MEEPLKYEYVIEPQAERLFNWKELRDYRELFYFLTWRDVKVKYKQTALGILWVVIQPVLMMTIFSFIFSKKLELSDPGIPYSVFVFSGLVLWNFFSAGVTNAGNSMVNHAHIIKKIYFPRLIIPFSAIISAGIDMAVSLVMFVIILLWFQVPVDISAIYCWPLGMIFAVIGASGLGCWLSALMVKYRDFRYVIPFMTQALLFLTPVIYPVNMVSNKWLAYALSLNPMFAAVEIFRAPILTGETPLRFFIISIVSGLLLFVVGISYFKRTERYFADLS